MAKSVPLPKPIVGFGGAHACRLAQGCFGTCEVNMKFKYDVPALKSSFQCKENQQSNPKQVLSSPLPDVILSFKTTQCSSG